MDRCDRCPARATAHYLGPDEGDELFLCDHHAREHDAALRADGWEKYRIMEAQRA